MTRSPNAAPASRRLPRCSASPPSGSAVPSFRYRALTQGGELVSGSISAPTASEVARRIEYLGLVPIETVTEESKAGSERLNFSFGRQPRAEDITVFTLDLALLLKAGAR